MSVIYQQTKCCVLCFHSAVCIIFKSEDIDWYQLLAVWQHRAQRRRRLISLKTCACKKNAHFQQPEINTFKQIAKYNRKDVNSGSANDGPVEMAALLGSCPSLTVNQRSWRVLKWTDRWVVETSAIVFHPHLQSFKSQLGKRELWECREGRACCASLQACCHTHKYHRVRSRRACVWSSCAQKLCDIFFTCSRRQTRWTIALHQHVVLVLFIQTLFVQPLRGHGCDYWLNNSCSDLWGEWSIEQGGKEGEQRWRHIQQDGMAEGGR